MESSRQAAQGLTAAAVGAVAGAPAAAVPVALAKALRHDLRAPVRHVKGFGELAAESLDAGDTNDVRELLARIVQGAEDLDQRVERLATWAHFAAATPEWAPFDLAAMVRAVSRATFEGGGETTARIDWRISGPEPCQVDGDTLWLQQVLQELLSNAIKAVASADRPMIAIVFDSTTLETHVTVLDNGVGLPASGDRGLFEFFGRAHPARVFAGSGMGLKICERIVHAHGGRIRLGPRPKASGDGVAPEGSEVRLSWPVRARV